MALTVNTLWKLTVESGLLSVDECKKLSVDYAAQGSAAPADDARPLAEWLLARRAISSYQAKILLAGQAGPFTYGHYQIYDRIESGRLAGIFRAIHLPTRHRVCLVFLTGEAVQDPAVVASLTRQAATVNRVSAGYPHLFRCYHLEDLDTFKFLVVEDLQGRRVERVVVTEGPVTISEACRITRQAALGLARLHAMGQVHGDVRPANLWLDLSDTVKVLQFPLIHDPLAPPFSVARALAEKGGRVPPEADYLAPELADPQRTPDARSDIYSLGCCLYLMLTNRVPFPGGDLREKLARHQSEPPTPIDQLNPDVPAALAKLVGYMMQKSPDLRYQQVTSIVEGLLPHMSPEAQKSMPRPPSKASQAYDAWLREHAPSATAPAAPAPTTRPAATAAPSAAAPMTSPSAPAPSAPAPVQPVAPVGPTIAPVQTVAAAVPTIAAAQPTAPLAVAPAPTVVPAGPLAAPSIPLGGSSAESLASLRARRAAQRSRNTAILLLLLVAVLGGGGFALWNWGGLDALVGGKLVPGAAPSPSTGDPVVESISPPPGSEGEPAAVGAAAAPPLEEEKLTSSGDPLWASPTRGAPLDLGYLAPGLRAVVALRPAALLETDEADKLLDPRTLGPLAEWTRTTLPTLAGTALENLDQALIGFVESGMGDPRLSLVLRYRQPVAPETLLSAWGSPAQQTSGDKTFYQKEDWAYYVPPAGEGKLAVIAPPADMPDILLADGKMPPPMGLEMEFLAQQSDAQRHFTAIVVPRFFTAGGKDLLSGIVGQRFRAAAEWFLLGEHTPGELPSALLVSGHLDADQFFLEERIYDSTVSPQTITAAEAFQQRAQQLYRQIDRHVISLGLQPTGYSFEVLFAFRDMVKVLSQYTRAGVADKQIVLRTALPPMAAHNLALGAYLSLLENPPGGPVAVAVATGSAAPSGPQTASQKLEKKMTLRFDRNTLEVSMQMISDEIGVPITILGTDLQLEGITKNQSFGIDESDQPAKVIMQKIMAYANPDGKLVYVIKPEEPGGQEVIFVTTRAAVEKRGDKLPPEFEKK